MPIRSADKVHGMLSPRPGIESRLHLPSLLLYINPAMVIVMQIVYIKIKRKKPTKRYESHPLPIKIGSFDPRYQPSSLFLQEKIEFIVIFEIF